MDGLDTAYINASVTVATYSDLRQKRSICNDFSTLLLCIVQRLQFLLKCIRYPVNSGDRHATWEGFRPRNVKTSHYLRVHWLL